MLLYTTAGAPAATSSRTRDKTEKGNKGTMATVADGWAVGKNYTSAEGECHRTENQKRDKLNA